jgi:5-methyltetrahydropteroyltriglutamate--homocysteine methyltransferase
VDEISIETAQPRLDCSTLAGLPTKRVMIGVLDLSDFTAETPEVVAARIRKVLPYVSADRITVAPDCGLKYMPRGIAFAKLKAMVDGAAIVRRELTA